LYVVVGALFTVVNVGGMMDNTSPGFTIPGQPQCLFCRQMCPVLDVCIVPPNTIFVTDHIIGYFVNVLPD